MYQEKKPAAVAAKLPRNVNINKIITHSRSLADYQLQPSPRYNLLKTTPSEQETMIRLQQYPTATLATEESLESLNTYQ